MKRILHVISTLEQGGTEAVVLNYFANIDKSQIMFDFLVIWGEKKGFYEDFLLSKGCKIFKMKNPPNKFSAHGKELKDFFKSNKYDIVHIHAMSALRYRVAKAAKKNGVNTVIYHSHSSSNAKHLLFHKLLKKRINKWCDYKFACSNLAGKYMYCGAFDVINNAVDTQHFAFNENYRTELRKKLGLENSFVIGHVGRLCEVKNQQFLIKLAPYLKIVKDNFVIFCVGEGDLRPYLQNFAEANGLKDKFILAGNAGTEVYKFYSMFDVLAFPSWYEGLSMVLMEAQSNGLPVVASDKITPENKVNNNFEFLPIDENELNYSDWAQMICKLSEKRIYASTAVIDAGYDIKTEAKKLQEFYLNI